MALLRPSRPPSRQVLALTAPEPILALICSSGCFADTTASVMLSVCPMLLLHWRSLSCLAVYSRSSGHLALLVGFWQLYLANVCLELSTAVQALLQPLLQQQPPQSVLCTGANAWRAPTGSIRALPSQQSSLEAPNTGLQVFMIDAAVASTWHDMAEWS